MPLAGFKNWDFSPCGVFLLLVLSSFAFAQAKPAQPPIHTVVLTGGKLLTVSHGVIENGVVVTITGAGGPVLIYTNHPNYSGSGGNGSTTGTFAGNGAVTNPGSSPPPFVQATASAKSATGT